MHTQEFYVFGSHCLLFINKFEKKKNFLVYNFSFMSKISSRSCADDYYWSIQGNLWWCVMRFSSPKVIANLVFLGVFGLILSLMLISRAITYNFCHSLSIDAIWWVDRPHIWDGLQTLCIIENQSCFELIWVTVIKTNLSTTFGGHLRCVRWYTTHQAFTI